MSAPWSILDTLAARAPMVVTYALVQSTLLLGAGLLAGWLLRRRGAATQSVAYRAALVAALLAPVATAMWSLGGVGGWRVELSPRPPVERPVVSSASTPQVTSPPGVPAPRAPVSVADPTPFSVAHPASEPAPTTVRWDLLLLMAWLFGSMALLVRLAVSWRRVGSLVTTSTPDRDATARCRELAGRMALAAPEVRRSAFVHSPCLVGVGRPVILLPEDQGRESLDNTLAHELAHVARRDTAWNLVAAAASAVLFFQPLLWALRCRMVSVAEEVCDDHVVLFGGDRCDYAEQLVDLAEELTPFSPVAVRMAHRSSLAMRVKRILRSSRALSTRAGLKAVSASVALGVVGSLVTGLLGAPPVAGDPDERFLVSGRVLDPAGAPVAGARVVAARTYFEPTAERRLLAETRTDADGRFELSYSRSQYDVDLLRLQMWTEASIIATKDGFGPAWTSYKKIDPGVGATLQLVADDVPVRGQLVDLEGQPVSGASVSVRAISGTEDEDLTSWIESLDSGMPAGQASRVFKRRLTAYPLGVPAVVTGDDGKFELRGFGRERKLIVEVRSDKVAYLTADVVTRDTPALANASTRGRGGPVHGARCVIMAGPTRPIEGRVFDRDSGEPLEGVRVESWAFAPTRIGNVRALRTTSDEDGRYRLVGMPKGQGNVIMAVPEDGQPYLMREFEVADTPGLDALTVDMPLKRGVLITGTVSDRATGRPVPAATLYYLPFRDNPYAQEAVEFTDYGYTHGYQTRYSSRSDGTFTLVGLPGRAILGVNSLAAVYQNGYGADKIDGIDESGHFDTYHNPITPGLSWPNSMVEIEIAEGAASFDADVELDSGRTVTLTVVGQDGEPVDGMKVAGRTSEESRLIGALPSRFDATGFRAAERRTMIFSHAASKQGLVARVSPEDGDSKTITLAPFASIKGRFVDPDGDPLENHSFGLDVLPSEDFGKALTGYRSGADGRFFVDDIPPGTEYSLRIPPTVMNGMITFVSPGRDFEAKAGEVVDLGDILVGDPEG